MPARLNDSFQASERVARRLQCSVERIWSRIEGGIPPGVAASGAPGAVADSGAPGVTGGSAPIPVPAGLRSKDIDRAPRDGGAHGTSSECRVGPRPAQRRFACSPGAGRDDPVVARMCTIQPSGDWCGHNMSSIPASPADSCSSHARIGSPGSLDASRLVHSSHSVTIRC